MLKVSEGHIVRIVFAMNVKGHERAKQYVTSILDQTPKPTYASLQAVQMSNEPGQQLQLGIWTTASGQGDKHKDKEWIIIIVIIIIVKFSKV